MFIKYILNTNYGVIKKKIVKHNEERLFCRINLLEGFDFGPVLYHRSIIGLFEDEVYLLHDVSLEPFHRIKNFEYIHHADSPSCILINKGKVVHLVSSKSLKANEEITLNIPLSCKEINIPIPEKYMYLSKSNTII
ncbi:hypothetical protein [uncultured Shewanella sp.]|uniref:hypothetical protein n=1 Tax=uncultured Shewanella sp. TaxID=173975 RepID=UPI00260BA665|nr:hypothetical protein [uncultured Shewanella sp.]